MRLPVPFLAIDGTVLRLAAARTLLHRLQQPTHRTTSIDCGGGSILLKIWLRLSPWCWCDRWPTELIARVELADSKVMFHLGGLGNDLVLAVSTLDTFVRVDAIVPKLVVVGPHAGARSHGIAGVGGSSIFR